jgi:Hg(II)-responsive transcriptional regulator
MTSMEHVREIHMATLTIGQLARQADVHVETIRYYERRELLAAPSRSASGYRQYTPDAVARIRFIKRAQELGFSLREIQELLSLRVDSQTVCSDIKLRAEAKVTEIEQKLHTLQRMKRILSDLIQHCHTQELSDDCPILATLDGETLMHTIPGDQPPVAGRAIVDGQPTTVTTTARLTCPHCGGVQTVEMPTTACQFFYQCRHCQAVLRPRPGDCCVFCSYADIPCPPVQQGECLC